MTKVLIIGATGSIGRIVRKRFLKDTDSELVLLSRRNISDLDDDREKSFIGDLFSNQLLAHAMQDVDVVFASLSGDLPKMASKIIDTMHQTNVKRLIFITSMGIYNETNNSFDGSVDLPVHSVLRPYREAADIIEASDTNYTIIRPGWFDNNDDGKPSNYEITKKGELFRGHDVSRESIGDLVVKIVGGQITADKQSLGINRPT